MCNDCYGSITFPNFVGQSCCNPCCPGGSVGGTSDSAPHRCCFCFDCDMCTSNGSGSAVAGVSDSGTNVVYGSSYTPCGCNSGCNSCNNNCTPCSNCCNNYVPPTIPDCDCSNGNWQPCCGAR